MTMSAAAAAEDAPVSRTYPYAPMGVSDGAPAPGTPCAALQSCPCVAVAEHVACRLLLSSFTLRICAAHLCYRLHQTFCFQIVFCSPATGVRLQSRTTCLVMRACVPAPRPAGDAGAT
jgi:hypothetical protein